MTSKDEALEALNLSLVQGFGESIDLNADIMNATREMAHKILVIRKAHLQEADRLWDIVEQLAESAMLTADMLADGIAAEWGIEQIMTELTDEDDEDDDDEE